MRCYVKMILAPVYSVTSEVGNSKNGHKFLTEIIFNLCRYMRLMNCPFGVEIAANVGASEAVELAFDGSIT